MYYSAHADVYVSGDLLIYYEEGNPRVSVAPDTFVVFGVEDRLRMNYKVWEEGRGPDFVLEVASPSTWREDVGRKRSVYARLGVREYFLFDPTGEHLTPRLQGFRLVDRAYERLPAMESIDRTLTLPSEVLGLELRTKAGARMRFHDPATGEDLLSHAETHAARREEAAARREEAVSRQRGSGGEKGRRASRRSGGGGAAGRRGARRGAGSAPGRTSLTKSTPQPYRARSGPFHAGRREAPLPGGEGENARTAPCGWPA